MKGAREGDAALSATDVLEQAKEKTMGPRKDFHFRKPVGE